MSYSTAVQVVSCVRSTMHLLVQECAQTDDESRSSGPTQHSLCRVSGRKPALRCRPRRLRALAPGACRPGARGGQEGASERAPGLSGAGGLPLSRFPARDPRRLEVGLGPVGRASRPCAAARTEPVAESAVSQPSQATPAAQTPALREAQMRSIGEGSPRGTRGSGGLPPPPPRGPPSLTPLARAPFLRSDRRPPGAPLCSASAREPFLQAGQASYEGATWPSAARKALGDVA